MTAVRRASAPPGGAFEEESRMAAAETGKRYTCPSCGAEFIVTRGGDAELKCGGTPLELKK